MDKAGEHLRWIKLIGEVIAEPEFVMAEGKAGVLLRVKALNKLGAYDRYNVIVVKGRQAWNYKRGSIIQATGILDGDSFWADSVRKYQGEG